MEQLGLQEEAPMDMGVQVSTFLGNSAPVLQLQVLPNSNKGHSESLVWCYP